MNSNASSTCTNEQPLAKPGSGRISRLPKVYSIGSINLPGFKTDKLRTQYKTKILADRSLHVKVFNSTNSITTMMDGENNSNPETQPVLVYTTQSELKNAKALNFNQTSQKLILHNGLAIPKLRLLVQLDLDFPFQIAQYLSIAASAASSDSQYHASKVSAACFYQAAAQIMRGSSSNVTGTTNNTTGPDLNYQHTQLQHELEMFYLGNCGPLSEAYEAIEHLRTVLSQDLVEIVEKHTTLLRWLYYGLCLDPDVPAISNDDINLGIVRRRNSNYSNDLENTKIPAASSGSTTKNTTTGDQLSRIFLTSDWSFYNELCILIAELTSTISPASHTILSQATSLSSKDKQSHPYNWYAALLQKHPDLDWNALAQLLNAKFVDPHINLSLMANQFVTAAQRYLIHCKPVVVNPLQQELDLCFNMFKVTPLIKAKWMVV